MAKDNRVSQLMNDFQMDNSSSNLQSFYNKSQLISETNDKTNSYFEESKKEIDVGEKFKDENISVMMENIENKEKGDLLSWDDVEMSSYVSENDTFECFDPISLDENPTISQ